MTGIGSGVHFANDLLAAGLEMTNFSSAISWPPLPFSWARRYNLPSRRGKAVKLDGENVVAPLVAAHIAAGARRAGGARRVIDDKIGNYDFGWAETRRRAGWAGWECSRISPAPRRPACRRAW